MTSVRYQQNEKSPKLRTAPLREENIDVSDTSQKKYHKLALCQLKQHRLSPCTAFVPMEASTDTSPSPPRNMFTLHRPAAQ